MSSRNLISGTSIIRNLANQAPRVEEILHLQKKGCPVAFAPDFSEIHGYILPIDDIKKGISDFDNPKIEKVIRYWYASKLLLENRAETTLLLTPYLAEMRQKLEELKVNQSSSVSNLLTSGQTRKVLESTIGLLINDRKFQESISVYNKDRDLFSAKKIITLVGKELKTLGVVLELLSGDWRRALDRLDNLWDEGLIKSAENILSIDSNKSLGTSTKYAKMIDEVRYPQRKERDRVHSGFDYSTIIDGWAIDNLIQANNIADNSNREYPFLFLISRADTVKKAVSKYTFFRSANDPTIKFQSFWCPDTYLAYQTILQLPEADIDQKLEAINGLKYIGENLPTVAGPDFDPQEIAALFSGSAKTMKMWDRLNGLASKIENISIYRAIEKDRWEEWTNIDKNKINDFISQDVIGFVDVLAKVIDMEYSEIIEDSTKELKRLWDIMEKQDERIQVLINFQNVVNKDPILGVDDINGEIFITANLPNQSIWIHFDNPQIVSKIRQVISAVESKDRRDPYFKALVEISEGIGATKEFPNEYYLWMAVLQICLGNYPQSRNSLRALEQVDEISFELEIGTLKLALSMLDSYQLEQSVIASRVLLDKFGDLRLMKILGHGLWKLWKGNKENVANLTDAIIITEEAFAKTELPGQFKLECINNLAYFLLELYISEKDNSTRENLSRKYKELLLICADLGNVKQSHAIDHTLGRIEIIIGVEDKNNNLIRSGIKRLERVIQDPKSSPYIKEDCAVALKSMENRLTTRDSSIQGK